MFQVKVRQLALEPDSVNVPQGRFHLSDQAQLQLSNVVDPLQDSDNYGIDIYSSVMHSVAH